MDADVVRAALARGIERGRCTDNRWDDTEWLDGEVAKFKACPHGRERGEPCARCDVDERDRIAGAAKVVADFNTLDDFKPFLNSRAPLPRFDSPPWPCDVPHEHATLAAPPQPRRFNLVRTADPSGVSGTGTVAVGVAWPSGRYTLEWLPGAAGVVSFGVYVDEADVLAVHGHNGATVIEWIDKPDAFDVLREWCRTGIPAANRAKAFDPRVVGTLESIDGVATVRTGPEPDNTRHTGARMMRGPLADALHHETDRCGSWGCRPVKPDNSHTGSGSPPDSSTVVVATKRADPPDSSRIVVGRDEA